jgi:hypothetical protein
MWWTATCCVLVSSALTGGCTYSSLDRDVRALPPKIGPATVPLLLTVEVPNKAFDKSVDAEMGTSMRSDVLRAFRESGRFSRVQLASGGEANWAANTMTAHVQIRAEHYDSPIIILTCFTVGIIPWHKTDTLWMSMTIEDTDGKELGTVTKQSVLSTWQGFLVPPGTRSETDLQKEMVFGLANDSLREFSARGTL